MDMRAYIIFGCSVIVNAFLSGYETGFLSGNLIRIRHLADKERNPDAMRLMAHYENPTRLITMLLVGTNLSLVVGTVSLTNAIGANLAAVVATPIFIFFAEVAPKSIFRHFPTRLILPLFPIVRVFEGLLWPITAPVAWISQLFLRFVNDDGKGMRMFVASMDDMRILVDESHDQGTLAPEEHEMIHSVIDLQTQRAKKIMVPRILIQALPESASLRELTALFIESGRTRIPIYADTIDHILGVVNAFDIIRDVHPEQEDIHRFIRPLLHVPDTMKLDDVLKAMRDARQSMAIVTDEHGGTDGLITVEDILEEIFGEIHDEYDIAENQIQKVGLNAYVIDADMPLMEAASAINVPIVDNEVETVGGWISHIAGRIPAKGEVIEQAPFKIVVLEGTPSHVSSIRLELTDAAVREGDAREPA